MKANELRIGNLVDTPGGVEEVIAIQSNGVFYTTNYKNSWAEIKPIPLTEEWLMKFGFERAKNGFSIGLIEIRGSGTVMYGNDASRRNMGWVRSVHELQNLYFAISVGHELTIK